MGSVTKYGTTLIVLLNTLFGVIGLFLLVAGFFVKFATDYVDKYGKEIINAVKDKVPAQIGDKLEDIKISEFVGGASTAFIVVGVTLLAVVVWAYCGTCCQSKWMLIVYAAFLTVIILAEITVGVLFVTKRSMIDDKIKTPLKDSIKFYEGSASSSAISLGWNALMGLLQCCGVDGPDDFRNATAWPHELDTTQFQSQVTVVGITVGPYKIDAPIVCAVDKESAVENVFNNTKVDYIQTGCYDAIWTEIDKHKAIVIGTIAGVGAFQLVLLIVTVCIVKEIGASGKNKVSPE